MSGYLIIIIIAGVFGGLYGIQKIISKLNEIIEKIEDIEKRFFGSYKDESDLEAEWSKNKTK